jgi:hypothetical protein
MVVVHGVAWVDADAQRRPVQLCREARDLLPHAAAVIQVVRPHRARPEKQRGSPAGLGRRDSLAELIGESERHDVRPELKVLISREATGYKQSIYPIFSCPKCPRAAL